MSYYTVTKEFLTYSKEKKRYIGLLMMFIQDNPLKVSIDKNKNILDLYGEVAQDSIEIATWLENMSKDPSSFEIIDVDVSHLFVDEIDEETAFLKLCSSTKIQKKIIVSSYECWRKHNYVENSKIIEFEGIPVIVCDKDQAHHEICKSADSSFHIGDIKDSMLSFGSGEIKDSSIKIKK